MAGRILQGLRTAPLYNEEDFGPGMQDPSLRVDSFNRGMQSELRNRAFQAARLGNRDEVGALAGLFRGYQDDIDESPLAAQREQVADIQNAQTKAQLAGFDSPQEAGRYGREYDQYKLDAPIREAQAAGEANRATAVSQAEVQGRNALNLERERQRNWLEQLKHTPSNGRDVVGLSRTRDGFSVRYDSDDPSAPVKPIAGYSSLVDAVRDASGKAGAMKGSKFEQAATGELRQAQENLLANSLHYPEDVRDWVRNITATPALAGLSGPALQQKLGEMGQDFSTVTPTEWIQLNELLAMYRGQQ